MRDGLLGRSADTPWRELLGGGQGLNLVADEAGKTADFAGQIIKSVASGEAGGDPVCLRKEGGGRGGRSVLLKPETKPDFAGQIIKSVAAGEDGSEGVG